MDKSVFPFSPKHAAWKPIGLGLALMALLALACSVSIGPDGFQANTGPGATPTTVFATPPFAFPGAGGWQPTPIPTRRPAQAQATPQPGQGNTAQQLTGAVASEVWDFPSGRYAPANSAVYYAAGGDVYDLNVYERPFVERTQDTFLPDVDLRYARLMRAGDWFFVALRLHGLPANATGPTADYGVELDTDLDGRGEVLVWASGPIPNQWSPTQVRVLRDASPDDVEGPTVCRSDAPFRGNGYDQVRYQADPQTGLAWLRWDWETDAGQRRPTVYIAFHRSLLDGQDQRFLWQAWADAGLRAPQRMTYHDAFTLPQAGSPYQGDPNFPIRDIARVDNTCRAAFGFQPTGLEPCLCETRTTASLCPAPETPPAPGCFPDGPGLWSCPFQTGDSGAGLAAPTAQGDAFFCVWDPELCQWSCRPDRVCLPPSADDAAQRVVPVLPFGNLPPAPSGGGGREGGPDMCLATPQGCVSLLPGGPGSATDLMPEPPTPPVGGAPPAGSTDGPINLVPGTVVLNRNGSQQQCTWNENLCRWQCRDGGTDDGSQLRCLQTDPGPGCQVQDDGSYLCTQGGELGLTQVCRWNAETCRWDCRPPEACPAPGEPPSPMCQPAAEPGAWTCTSELGAQVCRWDEARCQWDCTADTCQVPDQSCAVDEAREIWVCPGKGEFQGCRWDVDQCRWVCWGTIQPNPQPGGDGEERQCQPEDYCLLDEVWYCQDGVYNSCTYDGCVWICE